MPSNEPTVLRPYPKLPRFDHPTVDDELYLADDLVVFEKYDGSNLKFTVFDDRFEAEYPDEVLEFEPEPGEIVFGGRRSIRGPVRPPFDAFDGNFQRALRTLDDIDVEPILTLQSEVGPITLYTENMVFHTIEYGYSDDPPPPLIGFDIHVARNEPRDEIPNNPFEDGFQGFLSQERVEEVFTQIGLPTARHIRIESPVDPTELSIPESAIGDVQAEGVVFRSDTRAARTKKVSERHREINRQVFGGDPDNAETGAEYLAEKYCTPARIRKQIYRLVMEEGREFGLHLNEELYPRVVEDIWQEEWPEIMELDRAITPSDLYPLVAERCIEQLRQMEVNAELNDVSPFDLWRSTWDPDTDVRRDQPQG